MGYLSQGDVLPRVTQTADQIDLNAIWLEMQQVLGKSNAHRNAVVDLLSFWHTSVADAVPQSLTESQFELASEYGEPVAMGPPPEYELMGYKLDWYDRASRFTWHFLMDADARQVQAVLDEALRSDNTTVTRTILNRLFDPTQAENAEGHACYGLWNGTDGHTPPPTLGKSFDSTHTHYLWSGNAEIDSADLETTVTHVREHGYGLVDSAEELICLVNPAQSEEIQSWKAGTANNNSAEAKWDFIRALNQPAFIVAGNALVGTQPPGTVFNLPTIGKYGPLWIVESNFVPTGYFATVATAGPGNPSNVVWG